MNRDEIIKMAQECFGEDWQFIPNEPLERFFHMAQAAMIEQGWRQCAKDQRTTQFCGMVEQAVQEEREACAKVADEWTHAYPHPSKVIADTIRARGQA